MARDWPWKREKLSEMWNWPHVYWITLFNLWIEENETPTRRRIKHVMGVSFMAYTVIFVLSVAVAAVIQISNYGVVQNTVTIYHVAAVFICSFKLVELTRNKKYLKQGMDLLDELTEEIKEPEDVEFMRKAMPRLWFIYILNMMDVMAAVTHWCSRPWLIAVLYHERTSLMDPWPNPLATWTQFVLNNMAQSVAAMGLSIGLSIVCKELRHASGAALTVQIVMTVVVCCTGVFAVTLIDELSVNMLMNLTELLFILSLRMFLFAWFSTEVTLSCKDLGTSAYSSDWINGSEMQKKELMMLVSKTMQPVLFGGLVRMDFNTFLMVFKTAFSYYNFLLASFQEESKR